MARIVYEVDAVLGLYVVEYCVLEAMADHTQEKWSRMKVRYRTFDQAKGVADDWADSGFAARVLTLEEGEDV